MVAVLVALARVISRARLCSSTKFLPQIWKYSSAAAEHPANTDYHEEVEGAINRQLLTELNASMTYLSMSCFFGKTSKALPGCQTFFHVMYLEEREHALDFINYQLMRGGKVTLFPVTVPEIQEWSCISVALAMAVEMEKGVLESLKAVLKQAECHQDHNTIDLITSKYVVDQHRSICEIGRLLTMSKRLVDEGGVGVYTFDHLLYCNYKDKDSRMVVTSRTAQNPNKYS